MKQCFLSLKDAVDNNGEGEGEVYKFATTGERRQMIKYDGTFQITDKMSTLFATMGSDKQRWMDGYSVLVDCVYMALSKGGKVNKDDVVDVG